MVVEKIGELNQGKVMDPTSQQDSDYRRKKHRVGCTSWPPDNTVSLEKGGDKEIIKLEGI